MRKPLLGVVIPSLLFLASTGPAPAADAPSAEARSVLDRIGSRRGICVVLGDAQGALALDLARHSDMLIYVQSPDADQVNAVRTAVDRAGMLGTRITVGNGAWSRLHLADNLADAIVVGEAARGEKGVPRAELLRVLRPAGRAMVGKEDLLKPVPAGTDDWSHPYHGPDNNPQSKDQLARAPYLTHFLAEPWYCPMPLQTVAAGGRLFKAFGHVSIKEREWPWLNTLIAQNAYNGAILWQRKLSPNFMIHRNTMIATPEILFLADDVSCKLIDTATGQVRGEITVPKDAAEGPVWKWMSLVDGVLYAMVGKEEPPDPTVRGDRKARGWPWSGPQGGTALGKGYGMKTYPWGFGQTILAIDPASKKVLWSHRESDPLDARAMCQRAGRIFFSSHGKFVACLDTRTGKVLWRNSDPDMLAAIGEHRFAQNPTEGFSSTCYAKCNDKAVYFAGPTRSDLAAISAVDGKLLWRVPKGGNSQLVLRHDGLYAMSPGQSVRYDYLSGKVLASIGHRVNCTRATGSLDSIFVRGGRDGTFRYDLQANTQQHICAMRPSCQDGVLVSHGHLFWGPWMCDCNLTLVGVVSLAPAGKFDFTGTVKQAQRLEMAAGDPKQVAPFAITPADWPTLRGDNARRASSTIRVPEKVKLLWTHQPRTKTAATAPVAANGLVFVAGRDGGIRALDAASGEPRWTVFTGGPIHYPPTVWQGRVYTGSGDGWVYCHEAATGKQFWRFRAAPAERMIPVYGSFSSTWPVGSGVLVENGIAYAAAGIANHDGTHVHALDAVTGQPRWHNHSSGTLHPQTGSGASVNGHLLLHGKRLHLAGGNMVPVAAYDLADGKCVTDPQAPMSHTQFKAGSELFVTGDQVTAAGSPLYSPPGDYRMVGQTVLQASSGDLVISYGPHGSRVTWHDPMSGTRRDVQPRWQQKVLSRIYGAAVAPNAILVTGTDDPAKEGGASTASIVALSVKDGTPLWSQPLPAAPVSWGLLIDRAGRIVVTLQDGRTVCLAAAN